MDTKTVTPPQKQTTATAQNQAAATTVKPAAPAAPAKPKQEETPLGKVKSLLAHPKFLADIAPALTGNMSVERQTRIALNTILKNPKIAECSMESLALCLIDCTSMGLEPDGRRAHLVPFGNVCTLIIDYKGYVDLIYRSEKVHFVESFAVFANDKFSIRFGLDPDIQHEPVISGDRGDFIGAYAVAHIKGAPRPKFEWMNVEEIEAVRAQSKAAKSGPWVTNYVEMAKKTPLRRIAKTLPIAYEVHEYLNKEAEHEFGDPDIESRIRHAKPAKVAQAEPLQLPTPAPKQIKEAPAQQPPQQQQPTPQLGPVDDTLNRLAAAGIEESLFVAWFGDKHKIDDVTSVQEIFEVSPKKLTQALTNWDETIKEINATYNPK